MSYTKAQTIQELQKGLADIKTLYNTKCVNWSGNVTGKDKPYSEVIAEEMLSHLKDYGKIETVERGATYIQKEHKDISIDLTSNRSEEIFAKRIAYLNIGSLGKVLDYQIPLKHTNQDEGVGKIDLISFNKEKNNLYLHELKYKGNKETLLRAILEAYTYFKIVSEKKLLEDLSEEEGIPVKNVEVAPAVLVTPFCNAFKELEEMEKGHRPHLKALADQMGMEFFKIDIRAEQVQL